VTDDALSSEFYGLCPRLGDGTRLPVRTVAVRIRPDVLSGGVINAVHAAVVASSNQTTDRVQLLRRQGGHLQAILVQNNIPYLFDAQLVVTRKTPHERVLILRIYYPKEEELAENQILVPISARGSSALDDQNDLILSLREACALVKLIRAAESFSHEGKAVHWEDSTFPNLKNVRSPKTATKHLRSIGSQSTSITDQRTKNNFELFPSLYSRDWKLIQASAETVKLSLLRLGDSHTYRSKVQVLDRAPEPSGLLDMHYCVQLYLMLRDSSLRDVQDIFKTTKRHIDEAIAVNSLFGALARPKMEAYELEQINDETESSPLDDELEVIQSIVTTSIQNSGILKNKDRLKSMSNIEVVEAAIPVVTEAFEDYLRQTQNERVERLRDHGTKMLAKKESWLISTYLSIRQACTTSKKAIEERQAFLGIARDASRCCDSLDLRQSVVFLEFQVDRGRCWVSAKYLMVAVRQMFQRQKVLVFDLERIKVRGTQASRRLEIIQGGEAYVIHPVGIDARDVAKFVVLMKLLLRNTKTSTNNSFRS